MEKVNENTYNFENFSITNIYSSDYLSEKSNNSVLKLEDAFFLIKG